MNIVHLINLRDIIYSVRTRFLPHLSRFPGMILMLHRVVERECEYGSNQISRLHVTVRHLENLIVELRELGYEIISLDDLLSALNYGREVSNLAVFTFDDAYRDTYELAFPLFKNHAAPFAVYVPTAVPDRQFLWWYYMLDDLVYHNDEIEVPIHGETHYFDLTKVHQKERAYAVLGSLFNEISDRSRKETLEVIFSQHGLDPGTYARKLSMTWDQIRELDNSGLATIGGHSVNHFNLVNMSQEDAFNEMTIGKHIVEEQLGHNIDHFCYPFGEAGLREFNLARHIGFKTCTTCQSGFVTMGHRSYLQRLPRIMIEETTSVRSLCL